MLPKLKISSLLLKRLEQVKQECSGCLFGVFYGDGTLVLVSFNLESTIGHLNYEQIQHKFPAELDLCGLVKFGDCTDAEANATEIFRDVDITDNPILLHCELGTLVGLHASVFMHGKLQELPFEEIDETQLYSEFCFTRVKCSLDLYTEPTPQAVKRDVHSLRKMVSGGSIAFQIQPTKIYVTSTGTTGYSTNNPVHRFSNESLISDMLRAVVESYIHVTTTEAEKENTLGSGSGGKKRTSASGDFAVSRVYGALGSDFDVIEINVLRSKTMQNSPENSGQEPINLPSVGTCFQRKEGRHYVPLQVEAMAILHKQTKVGRLYDILIESICRSLRLFENILVERLEEQAAAGEQINLLVPRCFHFCPQVFGHFLTCAYLNGVSDDDANMQEKRKRLHRHFGLPVTRPYFRRNNGCQFRSEVSRYDAPLLNPHIGLRASGIDDGQQSLVQGNYFYYHYMQQKFNDDGWGCAYRSLQTVCSWFLLQGYTERAVPTHREIQDYLVRIGDKQASFAGSSQWIGSTEVSMCLQGFLNVDSIIRHVTSGAELTHLAPDLVMHFQTQGTPVMIGGGVLAHTILGVDYCPQSGQVKFLILDPHYTGEDDLHLVQAKGWCGWKAANFWDKKSYYNLCLPQRPLMF